MSSFCVLDIHARTVCIRLVFIAGARSAAGAPSFCAPPPPYLCHAQALFNCTIKELVNLCEDSVMSVLPTRAPGSGGAVRDGLMMSQLRSCATCNNLCRSCLASVLPGCSPSSHPCCRCSRLPSVSLCDGPPLGSRLPVPHRFGPLQHPPWGPVTVASRPSSASSQRPCRTPF